jgi:hypothetical protein
LTCLTSRGVCLLMLLQHEVSPDPLLITSTATVREEQQTGLDPLLANAALVPHADQTLSNGDLFYSDPFLTLFEDDALQVLPQITDSFYADSSTVRTNSECLSPNHFSQRKL